MLSGEPRPTEPGDTVVAESWYDCSSLAASSRASMALSTLALWLLMAPASRAAAGKSFSERNQSLSESTTSSFTEYPSLALDSESESPKPENSDAKLVLPATVLPLDAEDGDLVGSVLRDGVLFPDDATLSHASGLSTGGKSFSVRKPPPLRGATSTTLRSSGCAGGGGGDGRKDSSTRTVMASGSLTKPRKSRSVKNR
uniref:Uncharacterized protein n=1 Tax=Arundo donax TaxID=35708 RepID=A0A0A9GCK3_ARUDO